jgi:CheY-like chemotaxis protein
MTTAKKTFPPISVLIIDDNPDDRQTWSTALRNSSSNYRVWEAGSGQAGLELCQKQKVDCVVLDLDMSDSSGFEVLFSLIPDRSRPPIAIVILTRLPYRDLHEMTLHQGAQACLVKQHTSAEELDKAIRMGVASVKDVEVLSDADSG